MNYPPNLAQDTSNRTIVEPQRLRFKSPELNASFTHKTPRSPNTSSKMAQPKVTETEIPIDEEGRPICSKCECSVGEDGVHSEVEHLVETECGHCFGNLCLQQWMKAGNGLCPACRHNLKGSLPVGSAVRVPLQGSREALSQAAEAALAGAEGLMQMPRGAPRPTAPPTSDHAPRMTVPMAPRQALPQDTLQAFTPIAQGALSPVPRYGPIHGRAPAPGWLTLPAGVTGCRPTIINDTGAYAR
jgi:hypothetical protein